MIWLHNQLFGTIFISAFLSSSSINPTQCYLGTLKKVKSNIISIEIDTFLFLKIVESQLRLA